ncbi:MAG: SRPBCC family protein [Akkermansiaceae bacterium]|nr:SRPBCC family protein [Akkermansiaceae bacterium]NJR41350.1 SRPBCC family protein [Akkermansiaceae bacterium]
MDTHTIRLHRVIKAKPELVYKAFIDPDALARWLPPDGYLCKIFHLEAKVGGSFKMAFIQFNNGQSHAFGGDYLELVPNERLRYTDVFDDPTMPGIIEVTVELKAVSCGTDLRVTQEGVPGMIPEEACYLGWQDSLRHLAHLVESGQPDEP